MIVAIGKKVVWTMSMDSPKDLQEGTVTKVGGEIAWVDGHHKAEDCVYKAYLWPAEVKKELIAILIERAMLKKAYDDSIGLIYELRNKVTREDL